MKKKFVAITLVFTTVLLLTLFMMPAVISASPGYCQVIAEIGDHGDEIDIFVAAVDYNGYDWELLIDGTLIDSGKVPSDFWVVNKKWTVPNDGAWNRTARLVIKDGGSEVESSEVQFCQGPKFGSMTVSPGKANTNTKFDLYLGLPGSGDAEWRLEVFKIESDDIPQVLNDNGTTDANPWTKEVNAILSSGNYVAFFYTPPIGYDDYIWELEFFSIASGAKAAVTEPEPWVRGNRQMTCSAVWVNKDNMFQLSFIYPYADNNWVRIYSMNPGEMVYEVDMPWDNPNIIVDLPDGTYTVKTFHDQPEPLQEFVIAK